jgi:hypothetical protein
MSGREASEARAARPRRSRTEPASEGPAPEQPATVGTQLRLVESQESQSRARRASSTRAPRARTIQVARARRAHWAADWQLDADTRRTGRAGVQAARAALAQARRPESGLPRAS